jgi:hypothetical protein
VILDLSCAASHTGLAIGRRPDHASVSGLFPLLTPDDSNEPILSRTPPWPIAKRTSGRYSSTNAEIVSSTVSHHSFFWRDGYDALRASETLTANAQGHRMQTKGFIADNGRAVMKVVTDTGVTGYIDTGIPPGAIEALYRRLSADLRRPIAHSRRMLRQNRRRTTRPMRKRTRRWNQWLPRRGRPLIVLR